MTTGRTEVASIGSGPGQLEPVVILGAGRSGTKFLRDILAVSHEVAAIPFDVNYVWRYGNEGSPDDALDPASISAEEIDTIRETLARLARIGHKRHAHVLLEKTVSNSLRVPFVERVLPEARCLHLIRDGRAVAESASRVWKQRPDGGYLLRKLRYFPWRNYRYAFWYARNILGVSGQKRVWGARYPGIDRDLESMDLLEVCARQWQESVMRARASLAGLPRDRTLEVRYEDLVQDEDQIVQVCRFCGVADPAPVVTAFLATVDASNLDKWRGRLDESQTERVLSVARDALVACGYDPS